MPEFTLVIGDKNYSSWSLRPWLLMQGAGIEFTEANIRLRQPDTRQQCLAHSSSGKVPVLKHNGLLIWDSLAIAEYLAELHPKMHFWPSDPAKRSRARAISAEMHAGFQPLRMNLPMDMLGNHPGIGQTADGVAADISRIQDIWRECRYVHAGEGPFLFGAFGIADAMYAPVVSRFRTYGVACDSVCSAYMDAIWSLPAMQSWIAGARQQQSV